jgi:hypothetical protein
MALANRKQKKQWIVAKMGKYATVGGGLGVRPKVYDTAAAAKHDIDTNPKLRGGIVQPYTPRRRPGSTGPRPRSTPRPRTARARSRE